MRFMAPPRLPNHRDLAADDVQGLTGALRFDQDDVSTARDQIALAVLSVPLERVESGLASLGAAREFLAQDQISALCEDAQRDRGVVVDLVGDRRGLVRGMERIRI